MRKGPGTREFVGRSEKEEGLRFKERILAGRKAGGE